MAAVYQGGFLISYIGGMNMSEKNDLDILIPDNEIKLANGETIVIKPFSFAKLPKVVALINSIGRYFCFA